MLPFKALSTQHISYVVSGGQYANAKKKTGQNSGTLHEMGTIRRWPLRIRNNYQYTLTTNFGTCNICGLNLISLITKISIPFCWYIVKNWNPQITVILISSCAWLWIPVPHQVQTQENEFTDTLPWSLQKSSSLQYKASFKIGSLQCLGLQTNSGEIIGNLLHVPVPNWSAHACTLIYTFLLVLPE